MTFICNYSIGGIVNILTSDTRRVIDILGKEMIIKDAQTKIHQITDRIICVGGGFESVTDYVIKKLKENCSSDFMEYEVKEMVVEIDNDVQKNFYQDLKNDKCAQIMIVGFSSLGNTYVINYVPSKKNDEERIYYDKVPYGNFYLSVATPEGLEKIPEKIVADSHQIHAGMTSAEMAQHLLLAIARIQKEMFVHAPQKVSEWLCYSAVLWDKDRFVPIVLSDKICVNPEPLNEVKANE